LHEDRWTILRPDRLTSHRTALVTVRIKWRSGKRGVRDGGKGQDSSSCRQSNPGSAKVVSQNMQELRRLSEMYVYKPVFFYFPALRNWSVPSPVYTIATVQVPIDFLRLRCSNRS